jgi:transcriptional regulator with XRE-family HTH domain
MAKEPLHFGLGEGLRRERKRQRLTQDAAARCAGLSIPTVCQLERGRGRLSSFLRLLDALAVELAGRNLPSGPGMGRRIASLRKRRGLSQRALARMARVLPPTVTALERAECGRLETLDAVLTVLGAGAYLRRRGEKASFYTHAGNSSVDQRWTTSPALLRILYGPK